MYNKNQKDKTMRYLIILLIILFTYGQSSSAEIFAPSYEEKLKAFNEMRKAKMPPMSDADKLVFKNAGEYLAKHLPNPGIQVGEKVPDFTLNNAFGKAISLSDELKNGPVILVFYRGAWCPFCNLHLHVLQESITEFSKYGARLILVTPQKPDKSAEQLKKDGFQFEVLSDLDSQVMKEFNLYFEVPTDLVTLYKKFGIDLETYNGDGRNVLPVPGSFVIDQQGIVRAMHANTDYKQRMEPQAMIDALKKIKIK